MLQGASPAPWIAWACSPHVHAALQHIKALNQTVEEYVKKFMEAQEGLRSLQFSKSLISSRSSKDMEIAHSNFRLFVRYLASSSRIFILLLVTLAFLS